MKAGNAEMAAIYCECIRQLVKRLDDIDDDEQLEALLDSLDYAVMALQHRVASLQRTIVLLEEPAEGATGDPFEDMR